MLATYADIVVVCVLKSKVILLYNVKMKEAFLQQNASLITFLKHNKYIIINNKFYPRWRKEEEDRKQHAGGQWKMK